MKNSAQYPDAGDDTRSVDVSSVSDIETMSESASGSPLLSKRVKLIAVLGAAVLVLAGGITGGVFYNNHVKETQRLESLASCEKTLKRFKAALADLDTAKADVSETLKVTEAQVVDKTTVNALTEAVAVTSPQTVACPADGDTATLDTNTVTLDKQSKTVDITIKTITEHATKVAESKTSKDIADAQQKLSDAIATGEQTLKDSAGKVQDNAVREQLREALDNAIKVKESKDIKSLGENAGNVEAKSKAVADAVTAKVEADAQAAADAQSSAAQRTSGGTSTRSQNTSGSTTRKGTTGSSTPGSSTGNTGNNNNGSNSTSNQQNTSNNGKTQNGWETDSNGTISGGSFCGTSDGKSFVPC